jgi:hypothetical protein
VTRSVKSKQGDLKKEKKNPPYPIWASPTFSRKLIYFGAFVVMVSGSCTRSEPFFTKGGNEKVSAMSAAYLPPRRRRSGIKKFRLSE